MNTLLRISAVSALTVLFAATAIAGGNPIEDVVLTPPEPIKDNSGKFHSPYTSDGVLAEWTARMVKVKLGQAVGNTAGQVAAQAAGSGGGGSVLGAVGKSAGRKRALESAGGWEFIKETSDISFDSLDDLVVYVYAVHRENEHYNDAVDALKALYPDLENGYSMRVYKAKKKAYKAGQ